MYDTHPLFADWGGPTESELVTIHPDGSGRTALTSFGVSGPRAVQPRWIPDGTGVLYTRITPSATKPGFEDRHIWVIGPRGQDDSAVLTTKQIYTNPVLRP